MLEHGRKIDAVAGPDDADRTCQEIEQHVIEIYDGLIEACPDELLLPVLENIQAANRRHLSRVSR